LSDQANGSEWTKEDARQWRAENREHYDAYQKQYQVNNLPKFASYAQTRRTRLLEVFDEAVDVTVLYERDKGICGICHQHVDWNDKSIDHIVPLKPRWPWSPKGRHNHSNTQLAHLTCNKQKSNG